MSKQRNPVQVQIVDLFAGCGGLSTGFRHAAASLGVQMHTAIAVELDHAASATYASNFGDHVYVGKIETWLKEETLPPCDVMVGGPPCQGFSALGKQDPKDPRNKLWKSYVEAVARIRPKFFVMENVPQFQKSREYKLLLKETSSGTLRDYELQTFVFSASRHGTPQRRKRAIVIGRLKGYAPVETEALCAEMTVRQAWRGLSTRVDPSKKLPKRPGQYRNRKIEGPFSTTELHIQGPMSDRMREMVKAIPTGGNRFDLPEELQYDCWKNGAYGGNDVMGRLSWDAPSVTIRTQFFKPDKGRYIHPSADRAITYAEAAFLQGFPADYQWCGSPAQIAKQIGNAVPVPLAAMVGRIVLRSYLKGAGND